MRSGVQVVGSLINAKASVSAKTREIRRRFCITLTELTLAKGKSIYRIFRASSRHARLTLSVGLVTTLSSFESQTRSQMILMSSVCVLSLTTKKKRQRKKVIGN